VAVTRYLDADVDVAADFYVNVLGFELAQRWGAALRDGKALSRNALAGRSGQFCRAATHRRFETRAGRLQTADSASRRMRGTR
jgi:catechol 2,3-dioxygenase-like lactoylglutathione lyase family enzyme